MVTFVLKHTGLQADQLNVSSSLFTIFRNGERIATELIKPAVSVGEIARQLRFSEPVAQGILSLDEHWDGGGKPAGLAGEQIPVCTDCVASADRRCVSFRQWAGSGAQEVNSARKMV